MYVKTTITNIQNSQAKLKIGAYYYDFDSQEGFLSDAYKNQDMFCVFGEELGILNGTDYTENDLLINIDSGIRLLIDNDGTLNISDEDAENRYEINDDGELLYKIP